MIIHNLTKYIYTAKSRFEIVIVNEPRERLKIKYVVPEDLSLNLKEL